VFTTRDAGKSWYRLAGAKNRAVDIAVGSFDGNKALYALTGAGLEVFDGANWSTVTDAPTRGRTLAIRNMNGAELVFIAGAQGVKAGVINTARAWEAADAPDAQFATVHGGSRTSGHMLFLSSRQQREILVGEPIDGEWHQLTLPTNNTDVASVVPDPFVRDRYYVGTLGDGVFVYEGKMNRYVAKARETSAQLTGGAQ
jgi:hypothetical protein